MDVMYVTNGVPNRTGPLPNRDAGGMLIRTKVSKRNTSLCLMPFVACEAGLPAEPSNLPYKKQARGKKAAGPVAGPHPHEASNKARKSNLRNAPSRAFRKYSTARVDRELLALADWQSRLLPTVRHCRPESVSKLATPGPGLLSPTVAQTSIHASRKRSSRGK